MEYPFLPIPYKPQIIIPPKIGRNWREWNFVQLNFHQNSQNALNYIYRIIHHLHLLVLPLLSQTWEFFLYFSSLDTINTIAKLTKIYRQRLYIYIMFFVFVFVFFSQVNVSLYSLCCALLCSQRLRLYMMLKQQLLVDME